MAKAPDDPNAPRRPKQKPARDPAKHSKKDPARPTRAKAARPEQPPMEPALADLLNPGIAQGTAGPGSQTGLKPPPDNSFDRRADFSAAHRARKSTAQGAQGLGEAPQTPYRSTRLGERRPESSERPWTPHRPPRPEKSEGGLRLVIKSDFAPKGDQP